MRVLGTRCLTPFSVSDTFVWVQRHFGYGWKSVKRVFLGLNSRARCSV